MQKINLNFPFPLRSVSVRYAHLNYAQGEWERPPATTNNTPQCTKFISGLDRPPSPVVLRGRPTFIGYCSFHNPAKVTKQGLAVTNIGRS
jgi:hypothetical protein